MDEAYKTYNISSERLVYCMASSASTAAPLSSMSRSPVKSLPTDMFCGTAEDSSSKRGKPSTSWPSSGHCTSHTVEEQYGYSSEPSSTSLLNPVSTTSSEMYQAKSAKSANTHTGTGLHWAQCFIISRGKMGGSIPGPYPLLAVSETLRSHFRKRLTQAQCSLSLLTRFFLFPSV